MEVKINTPPEKYKKMRVELGLKVKDWIELLGISMSAHEKYSAGIQPIPRYVGNHLKTLATLHRLKYYEGSKD